MPGGRAVMITTRWHEEDPAAIFEADGWAVLPMSAIDEAGKSTYPTYWTMPELEKRRIDLGHRRFELMFQNNVLPSEGVIFKHEWWRYWQTPDNPYAPWEHPDPNMRQPVHAVVQVWDTSFKAKQQNDYSACETWYVCAGGYYLVNAWRGKLDFPRLKVVAVALYEQHKPMAVLIEDAASGQDLIPELRATTRIPVLPIKVKGDKVARAQSVTPLIEAGNVFLPWSEHWRPEWEFEHEIFPGGANDDWVDDTSHFLGWARNRQFSGPMAQPSGMVQKSRWRTQ